MSWAFIKNGFSPTVNVRVHLCRCGYFYEERRERKRNVFVDKICFGLFPFHALHTLIQASDNGNVSISILSFTPTREDNGKVLICRAINEVMKHNMKETTLKLNIYCKYIYVCYLRWNIYFY